MITVVPFDGMQYRPISWTQVKCPAIVDHVIRLAHRTGYCGYLFRRALEAKLATRTGVVIRSNWIHSTTTT